MKKLGWIIGGLVVLALIIVATVWAFGPGKQPQQFAKLDKLRKETFNQLMDSNADPKKREDAGRQFNDELQKLNPEEREAFMTENRSKMEEQMIELQEKQMAEFFSKSKAEQNAEIDRMVDMMKELQNAMGRGNGPPAALMRGGQPPADMMRMMMMMGGGQGGGFGGGGRGGSAGGGPQSFGRNEAGQSDRVQRSQQMLNRTSPQMRAQMDEMGRMMSDRMNRPR